MILFSWIPALYNLGISEVGKLFDLAGKNVRLLVLVVIVSLGCSWAGYKYSYDDLKEEQNTKNLEISHKIDKLGEKLEHKIDELKNILILKGN